MLQGDQLSTPLSHLLPTRPSIRQAGPAWGTCPQPSSDRSSTGQANEASDPAAFDHFLVDLFTHDRLHRHQHRRRREGRPCVRVHQCGRREGARHGVPCLLPNGASRRALGCQEHVRAQKAAQQRSLRRKVRGPIGASLSHDLHRQLETTTGARAERRRSQQECARLRRTYCSKKFLGVCLTKRKAYCCFESKLARILQEQGRRQLGVTNRHDPAQNIDGGARYLRQMLDKFGSVHLSLAAYNAGPGAVARAGGIPRNRETPGYVRAVINRWTVYQSS